MASGNRSNVTEGSGSTPLRCEGVVLRTHPFGDSDLIVRILTPSHGKIGCIAKGSRAGRKKLGAPIDLFDRAHFELRPARGSLQVIGSIVPGRAFRRLRDNLDTLALSSLVAESIDVLTIEAGEPTIELYEVVILALSALDEATELSQALRTTVLGVAKILAVLGHLDLEKVGDPSAKALLRLLDRIEQVSEKRLDSRRCVEDTLRAFITHRERSGAKSESTCND